MQVEPRRDEVVPATSAGGAASSSTGQLVNILVGMEQAQFDVEITEAIPEAQRVRGGAGEQEGPQDQRLRGVLHGHRGCSAGGL